MAPFESLRNQLEISLLQQDLEEEKDKRSALELKNTRLENEIRDLSEKLSLATAQAPQSRESENSLSISISMTPNVSRAIDIEEAREPQKPEMAAPDANAPRPSTLPIENNTASSLSHQVLPSRTASRSIAAVDEAPSSLVRRKRKTEPQSPTLEGTSQKRMKIEETKAIASSERTTISSSELKKFSTVKIKKDKAVVFAESRGIEYLEGATTLTINPPASTKTFPRVFLCRNGGSPMDFLAYSKDNSRLSVYPISELNPWMPTSPGGPGLLLSCRKSLTKQQCTLWSRVQQKPVARWMYFGQYNCVVVGKLTPQDFAKQERQVKERWAKKLLSAKKCTEYADMHARMLSRKRKRAQSRTSSELTVKDVIASLEAGEEQIDVVRMNCIVYDHEFVEGMSSALNTWIPQSKEKKEKAKASKKGGSRGARRARPSDGSSGDDDE